MTYLSTQLQKRTLHKLVSATYDAEMYKAQVRGDD